MDRETFLEYFNTVEILGVVTLSCDFGHQVLVCYSSVSHDMVRKIMWNFRLV